MRSLSAIVREITVLLLIVSLGAPALAKKASNRCEAQPGDTVYSICRRNHITVEQFAKLNPGVDINRLKVGASIKIKAAGRARHAARGPRPASGKGLAGVSGKGFPETTGTTGRSKPLPASKRKESPYLAYSDPAAEDKSEPSVAVSLVRVVLALVFVAALAYLSLLALKGFMLRKVPSKSSRQRLPCAGNHRTRNQQGSARGADRRQAPPGRLDHDQISLISELEALSEPESAQVEQPIDFASVLSRASAASKISDILRDGASFLQKKTIAAKTLQQEAGGDEK